MSEQIRTARFTNGVGKKETKETEVLAKARRRTLSTAYKMRILAEAEACTEHGQLGALLRREGLYSSSLREWRRKRDEGAFGALEPKKRGPKVVADPALVLELAKQKKRIGQLEKKLKRAEMIIDVQKKVSALLGVSLDAMDETDETS